MENIDGPNSENLFDSHSDKSEGRNSYLVTSSDSSSDTSGSSVCSGCSCCNSDSDEDDTPAVTSPSKTSVSKSTPSPEKRARLDNQNSSNKTSQLVMPSDSSGSSDSEDEDTSISPTKNNVSKTAVSDKGKSNLTKKSNAEEHLCLVIGCKRSFKTKEALISHFRVDHEHNRMPFRCLHPGCSTKFSKAAHLATHAKTHQQRSLKCKECWKVFPTEESFEIHKEKHDAGKSYKCVMCFIPFSNVQRFKAHMASVHTTAPEKAVSSTVGKSEFSTDKNLLAHMRSQKQTAKTITLKCPVCGLICDDKKSFESHKETHSNCKPISCQICGESFAFKFRLVAHLNTRHLGLAPIECSICDEVFKSQTDLNVHKSKHVKKENEVFCEVCGDCFENEKLLDNHTSMMHCDENESSDSD